MSKFKPGDKVYIICNNELKEYIFDHDNTLEDYSITVNVPGTDRTLRLYSSEYMLCTSAKEAIDHAISYCTMKIKNNMDAIEYHEENVHKLNKTILQLQLELTTFQLK